MRFIINFTINPNITISIHTLWALYCATQGQLGWAIFHLLCGTFWLTAKLRIAQNINN
jgi:hypothetical protein